MIAMEDIIALSLTASTYLLAKTGTVIMAASAYDPQQLLSAMNPVSLAVKSWTYCTQEPVDNRISTSPLQLVIIQTLAT